MNAKQIFPVILIGVGMGAVSGCPKKNRRFQNI
jgi:hypothetical protein